ncbi:MAG: tryptophan--tRNA ligase [Chloroflexi bacterium]|nr:tryptophan--tRNA ligase [Chloroflexota bacterium]
MQKRVISGIQPSGELTLGNYLGALRRWVSMQDHYENYFCIVDLHAITEPQDPQELRRRVRDIAAFYLAAGLDTRRSVIFIQSHIRAHSELGWILNCMTPMGWLERMTQFKDKAAKGGRERISVGVFDYPVLMAADILIYQAHLVPVGDDQRQHVELTRDIAIRFNNRFGETFTIPEAFIGDTGARIMSLADPTQKMSKSTEDPNGTITLLDPPDLVRRKIMRAKTDSGSEACFDPTRPGITNLLEIYSTLTGLSRSQTEDHFAGHGYGDVKRELADLVIAALEPLQREHHRYIDDLAALDHELQSGSDRATAIAERTLRDVQEKVGVR